MPNTNVFTGMDGAITVAVDDAESPEGDAAKAVAEAFGLTPDRPSHRRDVQVDSAMRPFHEIGQRYATELRPGNVNVSGTMGRAYINGALLKLMLGDAGGARGPAARSSARRSTSACGSRTPRQAGRASPSPCTGSSSTAGASPCPRTTS